MKNISQEEYENAFIRLEELIDVVTDDTPLDSPLGKEFLKITDVIETYETIHFPII